MPMEATRSMISHGGMTNDYWSEAVVTSAVHYQDFHFDTIFLQLFDINPISIII